MPQKDLPLLSRASRPTCLLSPLLGKHTLSSICTLSRLFPTVANATFLQTQGSVPRAPPEAEVTAPHQPGEGPLAPPHSVPHSSAGAAELLGAASTSRGSASHKGPQGVGLRSGVLGPRRGRDQVQSNQITISKNTRCPTRNNLNNSHMISPSGTHLQI